MEDKKKLEEFSKEYKKQTPFEKDLNYDESKKELYNKISDEVIFEVMTDGSGLWVSREDMAKICTQITKQELEFFGINFDPEDSLNGGSISVSDKFCIYVRNKTVNPKYIPHLVKVKTLTRERYDEEEYGHLSR